VPSCVREYSTAIAFDAVTRLATSHVNSRLRRVLVSMRCETLLRWRRNSPCRRGLSLSENKICGVRLPMKVGGGTFDPGIVFIVFCLLQKSSGETTFDFASHTFLRARHPVPACQSLRDERNQGHMCTHAVSRNAGCTLLHEGRELAL
jgi:hypothetical protein